MLLLVVLLGTAQSNKGGGGPGGAGQSGGFGATRSSRMSSGDLEATETPTLPEPLVTHTLLQAAAAAAAAAASFNQDSFVIGQPLPLVFPFRPPPSLLPDTTTTIHEMSFPHPITERHLSSNKHAIFRSLPLGTRNTPPSRLRA